MPQHISTREFWLDFDFQLQRVVVRPPAGAASRRAASALFGGGRRGGAVDSERAAAGALGIVAEGEGAGAREGLF